MTGDESRASARIDRRRQKMVKRTIADRGIHNSRVLDAMSTVPRERFIPTELADSAYRDRPLPIGSGQTISQPYIVALMIDEADITATDRVLEVGTGSGYGAAVLSRVAGRVWTLERIESLSHRAAAVLEDLGYENIECVVGDGSLGWEPAAPYDAIVVTAGTPVMPTALVEQLVDGGRLIIPIGPEPHGQRLLRIRRRGDRIEEEELGPVTFVPLLGGIVDDDVERVDDHNDD